MRERRDSMLRLLQPFTSRKRTPVGQLMRSAPTLHTVQNEQAAWRQKSRRLDQVGHYLVRFPEPLFCSAPANIRSRRRHFRL